MNRNAKIGLVIGGVAITGFLIYWFGFKKPSESTAKGGGDDDSEIIYDKKSRRIKIV